MSPTIYSLRGVLVSLPILFVLFFPRPLSIDRHALSGLGMGLVMLGVALRLWAEQHLHYRIEARMELTTTGPYQFIRNPLYVGNILIFAGTVQTSGRSWIALATVVWSAAVYSGVVRFEEKRLERRHGEAYRAYMAAVPRWLPLGLGGRRFEFLNHHILASVSAEFMWLALPLLVIARRIF